MNENKSKSDIVLKVILYIGVLGLIAIFMIFLMLFFKDRFIDLDNYEHSYTLKPGLYEVGVHLPAGTYVVQLEEGKEGEFDICMMEDSSIYTKSKYYVYDNEKGEKDIIKRPYFGIYALGRSVPTYKRIKSITIDEGQILNIESMASIIFYSNDIEEIINSNRIEVKHSDVTLALNASRAGKDFPAGVYDILYEPKDSSQKGTINCAIKDISAIYSLVNYSFECEGKMDSQVVAHGIPFTPGSSINIGNLDGVILVPTKYIGKTFNSLTWESDSN